MKKLLLVIVALIIICLVALNFVGRSQPKATDTQTYTDPSAVKADQTVTPTVCVESDGVTPCKG